RAEDLRESSLVFLDFEVVFVFGEVFRHGDRLYIDPVPPVERLIDAGTGGSGSRLGCSARQGWQKQPAQAWRVSRIASLECLLTFSAENNRRYARPFPRRRRQGPLRR